MIDLDRVFPRISLNVPLEYEGFERFHPDRTLNISAGGMFILTPRPLPMGKQLRLSFELPELAMRMQVSGIVVWSPGPHAVGAGLRHPMGMGVVFDHTDAEAARILDQYVIVKSGLLSVDPRIGGEIPSHLRYPASSSDEEDKDLTIPDMDDFFPV